ncbi:hypothetical protein TNCV_2546591 [Trichonephila clavipes]|nr:hypothetical protein TNCV_2546591 [Trichonephila clavipes]
MNETSATNTERAGRRSDAETSWRRSGTNEGRTRKESIAKRDHGGGEGGLSGICHFAVASAYFNLGCG